MGQVGAGDDGRGQGRLERGRPWSPGNGIEVLEKLVSEVDFFFKKRPKFGGRPLTHFFGTVKRNFHYGRPQVSGSILRPES